MSGRLAGKAALITGAGSVGPGWGNGRATAVIFAREGAALLLADRDRGALEETAGRARAEGARVVTHECDVTDGGQVGAMVSRCAAELAELDVLVNNVGGSLPGGPVELEEKDWQAQFAVNLTSVFLCCKHAIPVMKAQRRRGDREHRVRVRPALDRRGPGSVRGGQGGGDPVLPGGRGPARRRRDPGQHRSSRPAAHARWSRPGWRASGRAATSAKLLRDRQARIPIGFMGDGRDTAYASLFLASDEARFITGTEIVIDGGMTARCD